jgi:hypothetical protein
MLVVLKTSSDADVEAEKFDPSSPVKLDLPRRWYQSQVIGKASSKALGHSVMTRNKPYWVRLVLNGGNMEYSSTREVGRFGPHKDVKLFCENFLLSHSLNSFNTLPRLKSHPTSGTCPNT